MTFSSMGISGSNNVLWTWVGQSGYWIFSWDWEWVGFPGPRQTNKHAVNCRLTSHVPATHHPPPSATPWPTDSPHHHHIFHSYRRTQPHLHTCGQCPRTNIHGKGPLKVFGKELSLNNATQPPKVQKLGTHRTPEL